MNTFTTNLINTVNTQHQAGQDTNGNAGIPFFTGTTAADISINPDLVADNSKLATSKLGGGPADETNALALANLATLQGGPGSSYTSLINVLGSDAQRVASQAGIQQNITNNVDGSVQSVQGVNLDEEMTNLVAYQRHTSQRLSTSRLSIKHSTR